ncbi:uncharacterized protein LOC117555969 isoform X2 [Gymnodraco acuticeps]|uniref:Uncharacterized protein LOC117555969 isoform X2 n=1 Tax=Gymnodraco acuticeps TaxID=8218 RepID=A0A6P8V9E2_GYMAC|nr:uncharacterized protein LOC117555969 isoform X2 [Gymnodraco acuticeps]
MKAVIGLLLILGVSHGLEHCDGRQDGAQCFGPLGGTVVLQLMDRALVTERYKLYKSSTIIFNVINNNMVGPAIQNRSSFNHSDGTFRLNDLSRNDSDEYKLEVYFSNGSLKTDRTLRLTIQAPVSSVRLASECLSQGEKRVSCSSGGGDSPQYNWTLGGLSLTDTELLSVNSTETNSITLKQHVSGIVACSVKNNVSLGSHKEEISNCGFIFINCTTNGTHISQWVFAANTTLCVEPTTTFPTTTTPDPSTAGKESTVSNNPCTNITSWNQTVTPLSEDDPWYIRNWPIMAGVLSALVLLLVVGVAVVCAQRKKTSNQPTDEDEQELTYAVVKIKQRSGRQVQQRAEPEVEYGQVKFSERPRPTADPTGEECVYAKVQRGR